MKTNSSTNLAQNQTYSDLYKTWYTIATMASPEFYQEGKESRGGFWRFLAFALTLGVILAIINDEFLVKS